MALTKISTDGVQDDAVTAGKIPANAVGSSELADNAVDTAAIANNAINADKIINGAVNTAKLADQAVTLAKFVHGDSNNNGKFLRANNGADPTFETVNLVSDTSPQLGGDLQTNGNDIDFATNDKARFGAGHQLQIFHNGTDSVVANYTGNLYIENDINTTNEKVFIRAKAGDSSINCLPDGAVELYYDSSKKFQTDSLGASLFGNLYQADNDKLILGTGSDLQLYHNGSHSFIDNNTGDLNIESSNVFIKANNNENAVKCWANGAVELYYNNLLRLDTTNDGADIRSSGSAVALKLKTSGGTNRGWLYANDGNMVGLLDEGGDWAIKHTNNSGTEFYVATNKKATIDADGLKFGNDTAAANALHDYEEGTWTPTLSSGFSSISYHQRDGFYTKIGNVVYFTIYIYVYQATGAAYPIQITLPFTSINETRRESGAYPAYDNGTFSSSWNEKAGCSYLIGAGSTIVQPIKRINGSQIYGNDSALGQGANNRYFHLAGHYYVP